MTDRIQFLGWFAVMALTLSNCTQEEVEAVESPPPPSPILNSESVREMTNGKNLTVKSGQIQAKYAAITASADTMVSNNDVVYKKDGSVGGYETTCIGRACLYYDRKKNATAYGTPDNFSVSESRFEAVMTYNGVRISLEESISNPSVDVFGGWMDESYFGIQFSSIESTDYLQSYTLGVGSSGSPAGNASWLGAMTGVDLTEEGDHNDAVIGKAEISYKIEAHTVDVAFTEIVNLSTGKAMNDLTWNGVEVVENEFSDGHNDDRIDGRFFGAKHQEVGGVFWRNDIYGAFGAAKTED